MVKFDGDDFCVPCASQKLIDDEDDLSNGEIAALHLKIAAAMRRVRRDPILPRICDRPRYHVELSERGARTSGAALLGALFGAAVGAYVGSRPDKKKSKK
jgi:hypothetical protein